MKNKLYNEIINAFFEDAKINENPLLYGDGLINDTYVIEIKQKKYILQRINKNTFPLVDKLMHNIVLVLNYIKLELQKANKTNPYPGIIFAKNNKPYFLASDNNYYRIYTFLDNTTSYFHTDDIILKQSATAFANFQLLLKDFPINQLYSTIENFHDTKNRLESFNKSVEINKAKRKNNCLEIIKEINNRKNYASLIIDKLNNNIIPKRVSHNDSKISNVLFDKTTNKMVCVIDYDTIMPGSSLFDFGDAIREGCNNANEDEKNLDKVVFDINKFEIYTKTYYNILKNTITCEESKLLVWAPIVLTYELLIRFLKDYLDGDIYFKINYKEHNLVRAKCQLKLIYEMEKNIDRMQNIVNKIIKS